MALSMLKGGIDYVSLKFKLDRRRKADHSGNRSRSSLSITPFCICNHHKAGEQENILGCLSFNSASSILHNHLAEAAYCTLHHRLTLTLHYERAEATT